MVYKALKGIEETRACYCLTARKRARELTRLYEAALRPHGLRATQFSVLAALAQTGPILSSKLAGMLGLEHTTLTRVVKIMLHKGLISSRSGVDGRVRMLSAAQKGKRVLAGALPSWRSVQNKIGRQL